MTGSVTRLRYDGLITNKKGGHHDRLHSLLIAHVYNATRRSILTVLIFHGLMNFTGEWLRISPDMYPFTLSGNVFLALFLIALWQKVKVIDTDIKPNL